MDAGSEIEAKLSVKSEVGQRCGCRPARSSSILRALGARAIDDGEDCAEDGTDYEYSEAIVGSSKTIRKISTNHCPNHPFFNLNPHTAIATSTNYRMPAYPMYSAGQDRPLRDGRRHGRDDRRRHHLLGLRRADVRPHDGLRDERAVRRGRHLRPVRGPLELGHGAVVPLPRAARVPAAPARRDRGRPLAAGRVDARRLPDLRAARAGRRGDEDVHRDGRHLRRRRLHRRLRRLLRRHGRRFHVPVLFPRRVQRRHVLHGADRSAGRRRRGLLPVHAGVHERVLPVGRVVLGSGAFRRATATRSTARPRAFLRSRSARSRPTPRRARTTTCAATST